MIGNNSLAQIYDNNGFIILVKTNMTKKELQNATIDEKLVNDNLDVIEIFKVHAKRLNKNFEIIETEKVEVIIL